MKFDINRSTYEACPPDARSCSSRPSESESEPGRARTSCAVSKSYFNPFTK